MAEDVMARNEDACSGSDAIIGNVRHDPAVHLYYGFGRELTQMLNFGQIVALELLSGFAGVDRKNLQ